MAQILCSKCKREVNKTNTTFKCVDCKKQVVKRSSNHIRCDPCSQIHRRYMGSRLRRKEKMQEEGFTANEIEQITYVNNRGTKLTDAKLDVIAQRS